MRNLTGSIPNSARAFTLIELIASMVVIGVIAAVAAPVIGSASDAFVNASDNRDRVERVSHAMERVVSLLRAAPPTEAGSGLPDITSASPTSVLFADGSVIEYVGSTILLAPAGSAPAPLCSGVTTFSLEYLGEDGVTDTSADPTNTQRINIVITADGQTLRGCAFIRIATGSPAA